MTLGRRDAATPVGWPQRPTADRLGAPAARARGPRRLLQAPRNSLTTSRTGRPASRSYLASTALDRGLRPRSSSRTAECDPPADAAHTRRAAGTWLRLPSEGPGSNRGARAPSAPLGGTSPVGVARRFSHRKAFSRAHFLRPRRLERAGPWA